jgi:hypothetical protein
MKKRKQNTGGAVGISSLIMSFMSVAGTIWIGGFQISALMHDVDDIQEINVRLDRMDDRFDRMEMEFHKMDSRVNIIEQRKH